jgi:hypothetical protein
VRVYATQSTHKTLTALRQGSMIHVNDQDFKGQVEQSFHEAYMTHTSTSPNYQIIASLDVGRRQVELEGFEFVQRQVEAAMAMRRAISTHPLLQKYFKVLTAGDMIPSEFRESGVESYYFDADQGWTDIWECWEKDEFALDATRVTLAVGGTGWDGDTFKTRILMDKYGIQINKTSRNTVLFMTNIGTTRSSVAYLIEVLVEIARGLDDRLDDASKMERMAFEKRVKSLVEDLPPLPDFSRFHDAFRADRSPRRRHPQAFFLAYDEDNCDYLDLDGSLRGARGGARGRLGELHHPLSAGLSDPRARAGHQPRDPRPSCGHSTSTRSTATAPIWGCASSPTRRWRNWPGPEWPTRRNKKQGGKDARRRNCATSPRSGGTSTATRIRSISSRRPTSTCSASTNGSRISSTSAISTAMTASTPTSSAPPSSRMPSSSRSRTSTTTCCSTRRSSTSSSAAAASPNSSS